MSDDFSDKRERYRQRRYDQGWRQLAVWAPQDLIDELRELVRTHIEAAGYNAVETSMRKPDDATGCFVCLHQIADERQATILTDAGFVNWTLHPAHRAKTWAHPFVLRRERESVSHELRAVLPVRSIRFAPLKGANCFWTHPDFRHSSPPVVPVLAPRAKRVDLFTPPARADSADWREPRRGEEREALRRWIAMRLGEDDLSEIEDVIVDHQDAQHCADEAQRRDEPVPAWAASMLRRDER